MEMHRTLRVSQLIRNPKMVQNQDLNSFLRNSTNLGRKKVSCWRKFEDYMWLNNHQYFYICCIHEYGGPPCLRRNAKVLILIRLLLFMAMLALVTVNLLNPTVEHLKFTIFNLAISLAVTFLLFMAAVRYQLNLKAFKLKILISKEEVVGKLVQQKSILAEKRQLQ